ncbi:hypothetical protein CUMW_105470 [Citrus unshiu]|uniref:Serine-threonine/tyrosine-protein kinase catalytic domain-containing protein n=1 Tax=Citrus unshiu TaxID=55188 RepID=A0A2H5P5G9_CITUN|nr:hypothetical protein CUMW_105470 [Citrus unshiu]
MVKILSTRTSHVNIVTLLGFCFEGHRRALIYEFVSNGSLGEFIYEKHPLETNQKLKWKCCTKLQLALPEGTSEKSLTQSDAYSYGMDGFEMTGRKKQCNVAVDR